MRTFNTIILAGLFLLPQWSVSAETKREVANVNLERAKLFAIDHNYEVIALRRELDGTDAKIQKAQSPFFPKLSLTGGADTYSFPGGAFNGTVGYLQGDYNLFNGFADRRQLKIENLERDKASIRLTRAEFRVGLEVERQFHLFLYKKEAIALKEDALKLNEVQQKMAKQKRSAGLSSDSDILEFDLRESLLQSDLQSLRQELEESRTNLKKLLGEEIGSQIEPVGALQHQHVTEKLMDLVLRMRKDNEAVLVAEKEMSVADAQASLWLSRWLPKLDVQGKVGYLPYDLRQGPQGTAAAVGIYARWDFFSGFETLAERKEAIAGQLRAEARMKEAILSAITQMEIAYRKIVTIQDRVDLEAKNLNRAKRFYDSIQSEYRRGVKNSNDLRIAAEMLFEAKLRRNSFKYEFLNQRIELEKALGSSVATKVEQEEE